MKCVNYIKIKVQKKDTCSSCDAYKIKIQRIDDIEKELVTEQENHHKNAELVYETKRTDKERMKNEK